MSSKGLMAAAGKLKCVKRQGWIDAGVPKEEAESVADHSFRVAFIAAFMEPSDRLDVLKMVRMALVHDIAEGRIGDLTPRSGVSRKMKGRMEKMAIGALRDDSINALWMEYERGKTPEAKLVREADVLERVIQAGEYMASGHPRRDLAHFLEGWTDEVKSPILRALMERGKKKATR